MAALARGPPDFTTATVRQVWTWGVGPGSRGRQQCQPAVQACRQDMALAGKRVWEESEGPATHIARHDLCTPPPPTHSHPPTPTHPHCPSWKVEALLRLGRHTAAMQALLEAVDRWPQFAGAGECECPQGRKLCGAESEGCCGAGAVR